MLGVVSNYGRIGGSQRVCAHIPRRGQTRVSDTWRISQTRRADSSRPMTNANGVGCNTQPGRMANCESGIGVVLPGKLPGMCPQSHVRNSERAYVHVHPQQCRGGSTSPSENASARQATTVQLLLHSSVSGRAARVVVVLRWRPLLLARRGARSRGLGRQREQGQWQFRGAETQ